MAEARDPVVVARQSAIVAAFDEGRIAGIGLPEKRIDTHLSHVFLAGDRAFKLKRAVKLPFADFTSSHARQAACEAEVEVNRRMAGALYIGAFPISIGADGCFRLGDAGEIVDWVVIMRRFDEASQFDRLVKVGELTRAHVEAVIDVVARVHAETPSTQIAGHAADYRQIIRTLRRTEEEGAARMGMAPADARLFEELDSELTRVSGLVEQRRREGRVRRGHGDLHLRNICLFNGAPTPFDALEFDARLAMGDVLHDVAFLLMDLRRVGLVEHANAAMNRYWDIAMEEEAGLALLPFFMSLRAAVRMAVAVEAGDLAEASEYRALGLEILTEISPIVLAIGGLSGAGKSTVAQLVAPRMPGPAGARIISSDVLRKRMRGLDPSEKADLTAYAPERRAEVYEEMARRVAAVCRARASVVADGTFRDQSARAVVRAAASGAALFTGVWLEAPRGLRVARVSGREGGASDANAAVAAAQQAPLALESAWRRVDACLAPDQTASAILAGLSRL